MKIFDYWWDKGNKNFTITNYRHYWTRGGEARPHLGFRTNGAKKKHGDTCLDVTLTIGYIVFNYTNFNLQGK